MKEVFTITLVIIGALIGAGFASGQEIYSFFYSYGIVGLLGILITCGLISIIIYKSLKIICENDINNYDEFLRIFIKRPKITKIINIILNILLLVTFYIMIAGFGAYFEQELGINNIIGSIILSVLTTLVFFTSVKGVLKISEIIVPLLVIFVIVIGAINLVTIDTGINKLEWKNGWLISSLIYCSYNIILLIPTLISINKQIKKQSSIKYISILCGILMTTISIMLYMLLMKADVEISSLEMPIVYVIRRFFGRYRLMYAFIILASIFTTAISIGIGFLQNTCPNGKGYPQLVIFMCISSLLISKIGFSKLVNFLYPVFGYLGIIQIFYIMKKR